MIARPIGPSEQLEEIAGLMPFSLRVCSMFTGEVTIISYRWRIRIGSLARSKRLIALRNSFSFCGSQNSCSLELVCARFLMEAMSTRRETLFHSRHSGLPYGKELAYNLELARPIMIPVDFQIRLGFSINRQPRHHPRIMPTPTPTREAS
jgi:hypothetical protein